MNFKHKLQEYHLASVCFVAV